jgi:ABC-2 type transport system ATP-binding protein
MSLAIQCTELTKTYPGRPPVEAVRGIDLQVHEGECFGILGPNGAGKTTTVEILEGLLPPTSGNVELFGLSWQKDAASIRQQIGVSLQETQLSEKLSVIETVRLFRSFYRQGVSAEQAIAMVSLQEKSRSWVKKLSGGQKQRLAVATALVGSPRLLFLDEPTTGLDPQARRDLWDLIRRCGEQGRTVLLTTHYMEEAERLCDRVAIVDRGQVMACGSPRSLIDSLGAEHVIEFTLEKNGEETVDLQHWTDIEHVLSARYDQETIQLSVRQPHLVIPGLLQRLNLSNQKLASLNTRQASLEDVFVQVAGRTIQQAEGEDA